jgi:NB-ARC domain
VLLERLRDRLFASPVTQRRVVLCGLGGIGKSALASHFASQFRTEYEGVFWVSAEAQTSLERSYNSLNDMVQSNFRTWCSDSRRRRWLLIIDNLDDLSFFNPHERIPTGCAGKVIVTSRRRDAASIGELLEVPPLAEEDATKLLLAVSTGRRETGHGEPSANTIAKTLQLIPLAICQCGGYVGTKNDVLDNYTSSLAELLDRIEFPELEDEADGFQ